PDALAAPPLSDRDRRVRRDDMVSPSWGEVDYGHEDERMAWVVADEGKGPDLLLEVLHQGNRDKDLVNNVRDYARLGVREYFVYDRLRVRLYGYRLASRGPVTRS